MTPKARVVRGGAGKSAAAFGPPLLWHDCREGLPKPPNTTPHAMKSNV
jgi:hypothetical protein